MRRRVHITLRASTQARANTLQTWVSNQLGGRTIYATDRAPIASLPLAGTVWSILLQVRLANTADADAIYSAAVSKLGSDATIAAGSVVEWHNCTHDELVQRRCVVGGRTVK